ncbi:MAG: hypothetical protein U5L96_06250 [Owenweeksia sp.]|nr:hypothetical protein [Owenweeksia sp.]
MATPLVYLMHIPKTAGMSLQGLVRRRYKKPGSLKLIYDQESVEKGFTDQPELELVMGHFRFGYHSFSDQAGTIYHFFEGTAAAGYFTLPVH